MDIFTIELLDEDVLNIEMASDDVLDIQLYSEDVFTIDLVVGGYMYENNYEKLINKPSINGVELISDKSFEDLGRDDIKNKRIKEIIDEQYDLIFGGNN